MPKFQIFWRENQHYPSAKGYSLSLKIIQASNERKNVKTYLIDLDDYNCFSLNLNIKQFMIAFVLGHLMNAWVQKCFSANPLIYDSLLIGLIMCPRKLKS